ncbi:MAG TPA: FAD-dependent oxidoreductase [Pirellulales bacterium]|nr:FAD-dependent oxidoreductase [Pirellulales bacterium]
MAVMEDLPSSLSTLSIDEADESAWEAVVIGAGPAGAMAARELARRGMQVLLVERKAFPRVKVCGACLNQRAVSWLELAGLGELLPRLGAIPTTRFTAICGGRSVDIELPGGAAVSRESLDGALVQAAIDSGAQFLSGVSATLMDDRVDPAERKVELAAPGRRQQKIQARLVLAADGLGRPSLLQSREFVTRISPAAKIGVRASIEGGSDRFAPGAIYMAVGRSGYAGVVRVEDGSLNLAAAIAPDALKCAGSAEAAVATILTEAGLPEVELPVAGAWRGTLPLSRQTTRPVGRRVFVLGDAAGYVEPFTGEGIAWALGSGMAVASIAERGLRHWSGEVEQEWLTTYRRLVRDRQLWCRGFAALLRRPALARLAVQIASAWPALCRPVVCSLNRPVRPLEIACS